MDEDWDAEPDFLGGGGNNSGFTDDVVDDWDFDDEVPEKPSKPKVKGPTKKSAREIAREKEQEEQERARKERELQEQEAERMKDPEYARQKREQEKRQIEEAESLLINDLFGGGTAKESTTHDDPEDDVPTVYNGPRTERERELGLFGDSVDILSGDAPSEKREARAPPSAFDAIALETKQNATDASQQIIRKVKDDHGDSTVMHTLVTELIHGFADQMTVDELNDINRVLMVKINDKNKSKQNKKKASKKPQLNLNDNKPAPKPAAPAKTAAAKAPAAAPPAAKASSKQDDDYDDGDYDDYEDYDYDDYEDYL